MKPTRQTIVQRKAIPRRTAVYLSPKCKRTAKAAADAVGLLHEDRHLAFNPLKPEISPLEVSQITLVAGLAVCKAIGLNSMIKWPNDIVINGKKSAVF